MNVSNLILLLILDCPLMIKSVIVPKDIKGFIYIEAFKQVHVKSAIEGIYSLKIGFWQQMMVPIKEMTEVLRVRTQVNFKSNQWVRIKRGIYKDDIAQIDYVDVGQNKLHLKLLPRINYAKLRGALRLTTDNSEHYKRKKNIRPPAKPFDPEAIRAIGGEVTSNGDYLLFEGNHYTHKG
jgi:transcription elongation factor SPT5